MFKLSNLVFLNVNFLQKSISVCTVKKFSHKYIYTGTGDIQTFPFELYVAADEHSTIDIKQECEDMLWCQYYFGKLHWDFNVFKPDDE